MLIYKLTNKITGKVYVGKTCDLRARLLCHAGGYDYRRSALHRAILRYGFENFSVDVLEDGIADEASLNEREIYWIATLKSNDRKVGYNLTTGGEGRSGWHWTTEQRLAMSISRKGRRSSAEARRKQSEALRGRKFSPEHRAKIAAAKTGQKLPPEVRAKISAARRKYEEARRKP